MGGVACREKKLKKHVDFFLPFSILAGMYYEWFELWWVKPLKEKWATNMKTGPNVSQCHLQDLFNLTEDCQLDAGYLVEPNTEYLSHRQTF